MFGRHESAEEHDLKKIEKYKKAKNVEKVGEYIRSNDIEVVKAALAALDAIGNDVAAETISASIDDPRPEVRIMIAKQIAGMNTDENLDYAKSNLLHRLQKETDENVKKEILSALETISSKM